MIRSLTNTMRLVGISGCDKSYPGTMMGMARGEPSPAIFVYREYRCLLGDLEQVTRSPLQDVFEAVGTYEAGKMEP